MTALYMGAGLLFTLIVVIILYHKYERQIVGSKFEWLPLLSSVNWKTEMAVRHEMQVELNTKFPLHIMYSDMSELIQAGFVKQKQVKAAALIVTMYQLTRSGENARKTIYGL